VDRSTTSGGTYSNIGTSASTSYNDTSASPAVIYYYKVRAYSGGYYSDASAYDSGVRQLATPTGVAASDGLVSTGITVSWSAVGSATSYNVYRSPDNVTFASVATGVATTSWTDTTIGASVNYYYKIAALANGYASAQSTSDMGYRGLDAPTGVNATDGTGSGYGGNVYVTWSTVTGATGYMVYRATTYNGTYSLIGTTAGLALSDSSATFQTTFYYKVRAYSNSTAFPGLWSSYNSGWRWNMTGDLTGVWTFDDTWWDGSLVNGTYDDFSIAGGDPAFTTSHFVGTKGADLDGDDLIRSSGATFMSADRKSITVAFWVWPRANYSATTFFMMCNDFGVCQNNNNRISFVISTPSTNNAYTTVTVNAWTHIVGTYDGATIRIYKNGALAQSVAWPGSVATPSPARLLEVGGWTAGQWNGIVDDLRIYRRVLTDTEISYLYGYWR
jgi:fibronectin type 3 domain-containing protein